MELARICPQNPHDKGLRGQKLESKGVTGRFLAHSGQVPFAEFIPFARAIMEWVLGEMQGWMSQGGPVNIWRWSARDFGREIPGHIRDGTSRPGRIAPRKRAPAL
jgi:hypothetical protein